ncbi:MAG: response regulator [Cyanobacteria bacterium P01_D01_bin.105]
MRILLVDDDEALMESLADRLIRQRYAVDIAIDGGSAHAYVDLFKYDLIVLDLMLPDGDGIEFCRQFRQSGYVNPLMILSANANTSEKVSALDAGADDYVIKPFDFDELCARIRALLRRENEGLPAILQWGAVQLDPNLCKLTYATQPVRLTPKEFALMELFLRHPARVHSLERIMDELWPLETPPGEDSIRTHVKGLRRKLRNAGAPRDLIKTVYGLGYQLNSNISDSNIPDDRISDKQKRRLKHPANRDRTAPTAPATSLNPDPAKRLANLEPGSFKLPVRQKSEAPAAVPNKLLTVAMPQAACRYLKNAQQLITDIEKIAATLPNHSDSATTQPGDSPSKKQAQMNAHKLAGSLGSFGLMQGSKLAQQIESQLSANGDLDHDRLTHKNHLDAHLTAEKTIPQSTPPATANQPPSPAIDQLIQQLHEYIDVAAHQACMLPNEGDNASSTTPITTPTLGILSQNPDLIEQVTQATENSNLTVRATLDLSAAACDDLLLTSDLVIWDADTVNTMPLAIRSKETVPSSVADSSVPARGTGNSEAANTESDDNRTAKTQKAADKPPIIALVSAVTLTAQRQLVAQGATRVMAYTSLVDCPDFAVRVLEAGKALLTAANRAKMVRVAIADDDSHFLYQLKACLDASSFTVSTFNNAQTLWQWLHATPSQHQADVLILDVEMPGMSGIELCQVLRADTAFQQLPIIFLTVHNSEAIRRRAFQAGADDFINKTTLSPSELASRLQQRHLKNCH